MDLVTLSMAKASESSINKKLEKKLEEYTKEQLKAVAADVDRYAEEFDNEIEEAKNNCGKDIDEASTDVDSYLNEALLDIPSEYYELSNSIDLGLRSKADNIEVVSEGDVISVQDSSDKGLRILKLYGKTIQDGTPTPDALIELVSTGDNGSVEVTLCNKNLFSGFIKGIGVDANSGEEISNTRYICTDYIRVNLNFDMFLSGITNVLTTYLSFYDINKNYLGRSGINPINSFLLNQQKLPNVKPFENIAFVRITVYQPAGGSSGTIDEVDAWKPQLEYAVEETEYINREIQNPSFVVSTPFRGIPAFSESEYINYIDSTGKKWICDEIDFERGVYVQRIREQNPNISYIETLSNGLKYGVWNLTDKPKKVDVGILSESARVVGSASSKTENSVYENLGDIVFVGSSDDTLQTLREKFNGTKILYVLATPIETPLTQEQLEAFKSLHSYYPISNIFCDENAGLKVSYIADTKNHIDTAFNSIKQIVLNN